MAVDHKMAALQVALQLGLSLEHRQIRACTGLGVTNGENDVARGHAGQKLFFLRFSTMLHQRRANGADGHEGKRCTCDVGFFKEDQLLGRRQALAAILLGPANGQPAVAPHLADQGAVLVAALGTAHAGLDLGRHQVLEVVTALQAQRMLLRGQINEHGLPLSIKRDRPESGRWWVRRYRRSPPCCARP